MSDEFPAPTTPPTPAALLAWLNDVIEGAWVDDDGRRAVLRDVVNGTAHLDIVPPDGWPDVTQVRYLIAIAHPAATPEPDCARCPHPPHPAGMCEAPDPDDETSTCGCEEAGTR